MAKLILISGGEKKEFLLGELETVGRAPDSSIAIADQKMSSKHARVLRAPEGGGWIFHDLGSLNGTHIGGQRVKGQRPLVHKDEITMGSTRLRFWDPPPGEVEAEEEKPEISVEKALGALRPHVSMSSAQALIRSIRSAKTTGEFLPAKDITDLETLRGDYEKLRIAQELTRALSMVIDEEQLLPRILDKAFELLPAERGVILQIDLKTGEAVPRFVKRKDGKNEAIVLSKTLLAVVLEQKAAVLSADATVDDRFGGAASIVAQGLRSTMCVPLLHGEELLGLLHLDSSVAIDAFGEKDLQIFTQIAGQAAMAIANARMTKKIEEQMTQRAQLQRLLSPALAEQVLQGNLKVEKGGELRDATVLFSDIRGFTAMSENARPQDVLLMLNEYFEAMVDVLFRYEGTLISYLGDAMMAVFGAPLGVEDATMKAVVCGFEMQQVLTEFNKARAAKGLPPILAGIGVNCGEVVSGMIGSSRTMQYTAIGDTTNTAARFCSAATAGQVVVSGPVAKRLAGRPGVELEELPPVRLKGKAEEQAIFRVAAVPLRRG